MPAIDFRTLHYLADDDPETFLGGRYYPYAALTNLLRRWQRDYPALIEIDSIGTSREGREIPLAIVTNRQTGPHDQKPAYYIDAEIHAAEVTGSAVALGLIDHLLRTSGTDATVTDLLDHTTLYVVPRIAVDGAEAVLQSTAYTRSTFAGVTPPERGLIPGDLNGDGLISSMRFRDPAGPWKRSSLDSRVMVKREPHEYAGEYYVVIPEGEIADWDGGPIELAETGFRTGIDFNRNFPHWWKPAWEQTGAGPYPLSEPEMQAVADFVLGHPNIHGSLHHHTSTGAILRPSATFPDSVMPPLDLRAYTAIGQSMATLTGYPLMSLFHANPINPGVPSHGLAFDWMFHQAGVLALGTELWSMYDLVGATAPTVHELIFGRSEEQDVAILAYFDQHAGGRGFTSWRAFDHPQLGAVEIGGWERKFGYMNPPGPLLQQEIDRFIPATLAAMGSGPRLRIVDSGSEALGNGLWRVWVDMANDGFLPTYGSETWLATGNAVPLRATIALPANAEVLDAKTVSLDLGHLPGRVAHYGVFAFDGDYEHRARAHAEWFVRSDAGAVCVITTSTPRAGTCIAEVVLGL